MSAPTPLLPALPAEPPVIPPEAMPDYTNVVTEDGAAVENIYSEHQMKLLTTTLDDSWPGLAHGRTIMALGDVGLYFSLHEPPVVPDVMVSVDAKYGNDDEKRHRCYFPWEHGKAPEVAIEIVSNREGGELDKKPALYLRASVRYYLVWDPYRFLKGPRLRCFVLTDGAYAEGDTWLSALGLGVAEWKGTYGGMERTWLRWCDRQGRLLPHPGERAELQSRRADQADQRADQADQRADQAIRQAEQAVQQAEQEKARADRLAEKLRALGGDPDAP